MSGYWLAELLIIVGPHLYVGAGGYIVYGLVDNKCTHTASGMDSFWQTITYLVIGTVCMNS